MRKHAHQIDGLVVAGVTEVALGALTAWPMAVAVSRPQAFRSSVSGQARGYVSGTWT